MVISKICGLMLIAHITVAEKDGDQWNYLISTKNAYPKVCENTEYTVSGEVEIAFNSDKDLKLKENTKMWFKVWASCLRQYAYTQTSTGYGFYYYKWFCDATKIIVDPE